MTKIQKTSSALALILLGLVIGAGLAGTSAQALAESEAREIVNRSFARLTELSPEERGNLEKRFQNEFVNLKETKQKDGSSFIKEHDQNLLAEALLEARRSEDLKIIGSESMPIPGFLGRTGRAIGLKMTKNFEEIEERLIDLPEDIQNHLRERIQTCNEIAGEDCLNPEYPMRPESFLVYTNSNGEIVHLGMNAEDEPVFMIIDLEKDRASHPKQENKRMRLESIQE